MLKVKIILQVFEITRTVCLNKERSDQFLKQRTIFMFLEIPQVYIINWKNQVHKFSQVFFNILYANTGLAFI